MATSKMDVNPLAGMVSNASGVGFTPGNENLYSAAFGSFGNMNLNGKSALSSMAKNAISGGLGALGSIFSSLLSAGFAKRAQQRQFEMNQALMDKQNQMQRDMILDETALKMQSYKNAGLSTASLAGQFGNNTAVPSSNVAAPQGTAHDLKLGDIMNAARQVKLQEMAIQSEINLNNANAEAAYASAENAYASAGKTDVEAYLLKTYGSRKYEGEIANLNAEEKKTLADRDYVVQKKINEMKINDKEVQLLQQQYDINWKRLPKELALLSAQAYREMEQGKLAKKTADETQQKIYNLQRERDNIVRQGYLTDVQADLIEAEIAKIAAENENLGPSAIYNKAKSYMMNKFPSLVKFGVAFDTALGYVRNFAEIYSMFSGRGGSGSVTTVSSGSGPKGNWSSTTTTTRQ